MAHKDWCGKECQSCEGCKLEQSLFCSPDCEGIIDSETFSTGCSNCGSFQALAEDKITEELGEMMMDYYDLRIEIEKLQKETITITEVIDIAKKYNEDLKYGSTINKAYNALVKAKKYVKNEDDKTVISNAIKILKEM